MIDNQRFFIEKVENSTSDILLIKEDGTFEWELLENILGGKNKTMTSNILDVTQI